MEVYLEDSRCGVLKYFSSLHRLNASYDVINIRFICSFPSSFRSPVTPLYLSTSLDQKVLQTPDI